jgi:CBS domain-containing membrane protein
MRARVEAVRQACIDAALAAFENAAISGLCHEGAWEAAVGAMRSADLDPFAQLRVRDVMSTEVATLRPEDPLAVADDVMRLGRIRHLPVVDRDGALRGLLSQRDLLRSALRGASKHPQSSRRAQWMTLPVSERMTREVETAAPGDPLRSAAQRMLRRKIGCLPVVEQGKLVGILTEADFVSLAL